MTRDANRRSRTPPASAGKEKEVFALSKNELVFDRIGKDKALKALDEVAVRLGGEDDYRPVFDRAYEMGLEADWDGTIELPNPIEIDGCLTHGLIDTLSALDAESAVKLGYLDAGDLEVDLGGDSDPGMGIQPASTSQTLSYGWGSVNSGAHFDVRIFAGSTTSRTHNVTPARSIRRVGVRHGNSSTGGRTRYRRTSAGSLIWSRWRHGNGSSYIRWFSFDINVLASTAQTGRGW